MGIVSERKDALIVDLEKVIMNDKYSEDYLFPIKKNKKKINSEKKFFDLFAMIEDSKTNVDMEIQYRPYESIKWHFVVNNHFNKVISGKNYKKLFKNVYKMLRKIFPEPIDD